jgi:hypothetical protein
MPSSLLDNLNSDLMSAISTLSPKNSTKRILVYVESDDDIAFWRGILTSFEKGKLSFDIQTPTKKGKQKALQKSNEILGMNGLGANMIVCVDSDYDYLLQGKTNNSRLIIEHEYIFQTYSYSIENLICYSEGLHTICVQSTKNDTKLIDFVALMELYSAIIYPLFLWSVYFYSKGDTTTFTISQFCDCIKILAKLEISNKFELAIKDLKEKIDNKLKELETQFPAEKTKIEELEEELKRLGLEEKNAYLFAQGHTIKDNVVQMFLKEITHHLKKEKETEIKTKATHHTELTDQMNYYRSQLVDVVIALNTHTEFKSCFLYQKIVYDLNNYITKYHS